MGNLKNRYIAVLKKCNLLNVFGSLAVISAISLSSGIAFAATNPAGSTSQGMEATAEDPILENYGNIIGGITSNINKFGMHGHSAGSLSFLFTNRGSISVENISTLTSGVYALAHAYGMHAQANTGNHSLSNYGTINLGAYAGTSIDALGGLVEAESYSFANGMHAYANDTSNHSLSNYGTIIATARGGTTTADADGNIDARAYRVFSYAETKGMYAYAFDTSNHNLSNYGTITATASGGSATVTNAGLAASSISSDINANALALGMHAQANFGNHSLSNYGTITATAKGGTATVDGSNTDAFAYAYGMYVQGTPTAGKEHLLNNYGSITATATANAGQATHAFESYGDYNYSVGTWATTLSDWSATVGGNRADTVFGVHTGRVINFKNSTLILRPGTAAQGFAFGQTYNVADMIAVKDSSTGLVQATQAANVTGEIAKVTTEVPFLTATLTNGNNPLNATIRLDMNTEAVPHNASIVQGLSQVQGQMGNISSQLSQVRTNLYAANSANLTASNEDTAYISNTPKWTLFFNPYYSYTDNSKYNFDAKGIGITGGASYNMNEKLSFGGHLDFNASDYDGKEMDSYITSFALGAHANFNIMPEWYLFGQITGAFAENDNKYYSNTGTNLRGDSLYDSKTFYLALTTGYMWNISGAHSLTPEIGLSYLSTHSDDYTITYNTSIYNMNYDESSYSALYADAKLNWRSEWFMQNNSSLALLAGAGFRQNLTGNEIETKFSIFGGNYKTQATEDSSTFLANIGLEYQKNGLSARLSYDGAYGSNQAKHTGNLLVKYAF